MQNQFLSAFTDLLNQLGIQPAAILYHFIALAILVTALFFLIYKPVRKKMKERKDEINAIIEKNKKMSAEMQIIQQKTEETLEEARKEAVTIQETALAVAHSKADKLVQDAKNQVKYIMAKTEQEIEEERAKLTADIEKEIRDVSVAVAEKILERDVTPQDNERLIRESLISWKKGKN